MYYELVMSSVLLAMPAPGEAPDRSVLEAHWEPMTCEILYPPGQEPDGDRGGAVPFLWTDGLMFYEFASNISSVNRSRVRNAMNLIEDIAPVRFIERTDEPNYIEIQSLGGNFSYVGMLGGSQDLSIVNWNRPYTIVHELTHALGRYHQQQRSDRNNYIEVNTDCIFDSCENNYQLINTINYGEYDFLSVMHYGQYDCTTGGGCTAGCCIWGSTRSS